MKRELPIRAHWLLPLVVTSTGPKISALTSTVKLQKRKLPISTAINLLHGTQDTRLIRQVKRMARNCQNNLVRMVHSKASRGWYMTHRQSICVMNTSTAHFKPN